MKVEGAFSFLISPPSFTPFIPVRHFTTQSHVRSKILDKGCQQPFAGHPSLLCWS